MAGKGQRFRDVGFTVPKFMINALGKSLFHWSLISLRDFFQYQFIFITRHEDNATDFIVEECKHLGIENPQILSIESTTDGQATTVLVADKHLDDADPFLVYNIDTYVKEGTLLKNQLKGDGFIPGFTAEGTKWSFIKLDAANKVVDIREKSRISDIATLGFYYFKSYSLYKEFYYKTFQDESTLVNGEKYIAPIYKEMIANNNTVYGIVVSATSVWGLGTPDDLNLFLNNYEQD